MNRQTMKRLEELEAKQAPPDRCDVCRWWKPAGNQLVGSDGPMWPDRCDACGATITHLYETHINVPMKRL